ncbi:hypothetical protein [Chlamydia sp.]|uniref:hypothetical protein n=1 Tax=Chlamydia sp. TaxID=35827 RepID=UPI0025C58FC6|nr:hypothetical protein [Chlamydia sp.]MBQ8498507.1 hypothetical protein [Chlamydia sp.]
MRVIFPDKYKHTPFLGRALQQLPLLVLATSCSAPFISFFLQKFFQMRGPVEWLALSVEGINQHYFWQWLTYPLVTADTLKLGDVGSLEITQRLLMRNTLDFILFYKATDTIIRKLGAGRFVFLLTAEVGVIGLTVWAFLWLIDSPQAFFGPESLICALLVVRVFLDPEKRLTLPLFPISLSRKWSFVLLLNFYFLILIIVGAYAALIGSVLSMALSILFCHKENIPNPYRGLYR